MKVPFHLQKRSSAEPPTAFLLYSDAPAELVDLCARLGETPAIFPVADGFLLIPRRPLTARPAQAIGLRRLGENLYLPCDADLLPALLEDEVAGFTRRRGLVFLPGNRVLAFDPAAPVPLARLLRVRRAPHRDWQTFPQARQLPERIVHLERASPSLEQILEEGGEGIGEEAPEPDDAGTTSTVLGGAAAGLGKGLLWLGNLLHWKGLAGLGAKWIAGAVQRAPRLSESILGKQEAALRALLNDFRNGNLEKALRRALPIGGEGGRGGMAATGAQLPTHRLRFSLADLLGRGGPSSVWFGGGDVQQLLAAEYRKAAREAEAKGDFRRAAFIFAKLLFDYRAAADALQRGGHYREAAALFLEKLHDPRSAARAFEAAGEVDRAVQLYRQEGEHVRAGELLKRVGEEEAALAEFLNAAYKLIRPRQAYLEAGELMLYKAERVDLALGYFEEGWRLRNTATSVACTFPLARLYVQERQLDKLLTLVKEAEEYLAPAHAAATAGQFFNVLATLADDPKAAPVREELRDRARMALARKMRQHVEVETRPGKAVSNLFGKNPAWAAPLVRDADFALKAALKRPDTKPAAATARFGAVPVGTGTVTAVCQAVVEGTVFLGFNDGTVLGFHPERGALCRVENVGGTVSSLAVDQFAKVLVVQTGLFPRRIELHAFTRRLDGEYEPATHISLDTEGEPWLTPVAGTTVYRTGWWTGKGFEVRQGPGLAALGEAVPVPDVPYRAGFLLARQPLPAAALFGGALVGFLDTSDRTLRTAAIHWTPAAPEGNPLLTTPLSCAELDQPYIEVAGLDGGGRLHQSLIHFSKETLFVKKTVTAARADGYLAAALVGGGLAAGVARFQVDWVRAGPREFTKVATSRVDLKSAVACFLSHRTHELLVIGERGEVARVPAPGEV